MTRAGEHASAAAGRGASATAEEAEAASKPDRTRRIVPARPSNHGASCGHTPSPRASARDADLRSMATAGATAGAGVNRGEGSRRCRRARSSLEVAIVLALLLRHRRLAAVTALDVGAIHHRLGARGVDVRLV